MKQEIHPDYHDINVVCTCGNNFVTKSTFNGDKLSVEICASCHPFYTGEQKIIDTEGKVDKFNKKFGIKKKVDTTSTDESK